MTHEEYFLGEWTQPFFEHFGASTKELTGRTTKRRKPVHNHTMLDDDDLAELTGDFAHINDPEVREKFLAEARDSELSAQIVQYRPPPDFMAEDVAASQRFWAGQLRNKLAKELIRERNQARRRLEGDKDRRSGAS